MQNANNKINIKWASSLSHWIIPLLN